MNGESGNSHPGSDRRFLWTALIACVLFAIPLVAMQLTDEVRWSQFDFVVWGTLLLAAGGAFLWSSGKLRRGRRWIAGALVAAVLLYVWAELAVGVFTDLGS